VLAALILTVGAAVVAAHWPALSAQATNFDDGQYFIENRLVQNPSWSSVAAFFSEVLDPSTVGGYYQPLSMTSLMLDWALGGRPDHLQPFHYTSLALHVANTILVIVFLYLLFGNPWAAAMAGLLFGVHPMTVETIPWVGERKTLLAAFFALWSLVLYVVYTRNRSGTAYGTSVVSFVIALLSKPTTTPLPFLLLLLDYWPLRRLRVRTVVEKIPFFVIAGASAVITFASQARAGGVAMPQERPWFHILLTPCHNLVFYPWKILWPVNLTSHYAYPERFNLSDPMVLAGVIGTPVLVAGLLISLRWTRALATGGLFFFVAILPTLGIIGFTNVIASDKYAYLPMPGLLMIVALGLAKLWELPARPRRRAVGRTALLAVVLLLSGLEAWGTRTYLARWQDTETLYRYMLTFAPRAHSLHDYLGVQLHRQGRLEEAIEHFNQALAARPWDYSAHNNLGAALAEQGKLQEAIDHFVEAIRAAPRAAKGYSNLGRAMERLGRLAEAQRYYELALERDPECLDAHKGLGILLAGQGKLEQAADHFRDAIRVNPNYVEAHIGLGRVLAAQGRLDEAIAVYMAALRIAPDDPRLRADLQKVHARRGANAATSPVGTPGD
jgi:Flp pilus assembly protein TadD